jgi:hypothetical protein
MEVSRLKELSDKKIGVVIYHRNILTKYDPEWTYNCLEKIENQSFKNFSIVELNFGGDSVRLYEGDKESHFYSEEINNLGSAISRAFDICFNDLDFDLIFNINLDDDYSLDRFEKQLECIIRTNCDVVTSNFHFTDSNLSVETTTNFCHGIYDVDIQNKIIDFEFSRNHNIIGFPVCLFTKKFWKKWGGLPSEETSKGREDFDMWIRARKEGCRFYIMEEPLFKYRIHNSNISKRVNNL